PAEQLEGLAARRGGRAKSKAPASVARQTLGSPGQSCQVVGTHENPGDHSEGGWMMSSLKRVVTLAAGVAVALGVSVAAAQDMKFFRIGTGAAGGTYFPIGGLIANAISAPPGSRSCEEGGACGVPG